MVQGPACTCIIVGSDPAFRANIEWDEHAWTQIILSDSRQRKDLVWSLFLKNCHRRLVASVDQAGRFPADRRCWYSVTSSREGSLKNMWRQILTVTRSCRWDGTVHKIRFKIVERGKIKIKTAWKKLRYESEVVGKKARDYIWVSYWQERDEVTYYFFFQS